MIRRLWTGVEWMTEAILILLVAAMTVMCLAQVAWRYVLGDPLVWSEEAARYLFVWISYLSAWLAWKHRAHIAVDLVAYVGNARARMASEALVEGIVLIFCLYTFYTNLALLALTTRQPSATLGVPMMVVYAGYSAMAALIVGDIVVGRLTGRHPANDPVEEVHSS